MGTGGYSGVPQHCSLDQPDRLLSQAFWQCLVACWPVVGYTAVSRLTAEQNRKEDWANRKQLPLHCREWQMQLWLPPPRTGTPAQRAGHLSTADSNGNRAA